MRERSATKHQGGSRPRTEERRRPTGAIFVSPQHEERRGGARTAPRDCSRLEEEPSDKYTRYTLRYEDLLTPFPAIEQVPSRTSRAGRLKISKPPVNETYFTICYSARLD
ncbi:hypothetical protein KM043_011620 [Ampulex compressa]|nr:hypothetical protein KM043_011620 [Ampulex compressa]